MEKVVFSKCSVERRDEYKIITSIIENEGQVYVKKQAATGMAKKHIDKMYNAGIQDNAYNLSNVKNVKCLKKNDNAVYFEFIKGSTLADILETHLLENDVEQVLNDISLVKKIIESSCNICKGKKSDYAIDIFGSEIEAFDGDLCATNVNIDLVMDNVIVNENQYTVIDYEWIFENPVPLKYILFRSIFLNNSISKSSESVKKQIYKICELKEDDIKIFWKMEVNFQKYISGKSMNDLYKEMGCKTFLANENTLSVSFNHIWVKNVQDNIIYEELSNQNDNILEIDTSKTDLIKVQLCEENAIIKILEENAINNNQEVGVQCVATNEILTIKDDHYFGANPVLEYCVKDIEQVKIHYQILRKNDNFIKDYAEALKNSNRMNLDYLETKKWNDAYREKVDELEKNYLALGDEKSRLEKQLLGLGDIKADLEKQLLGLGDIKADLEKQNDTLLNEKDSLEQKVRELECKIEAKDSDLAESKQNNNILSVELAKVRQNRLWKIISAREKRK